MTDPDDSSGNTGSGAVREITAPRARGTEGCEIRRAPVGSVTFYEVQEHELRTLESGGAGTLLINIGLSALSVGVSTLAACLSSTMSNTVLIWFAATTVVALVSGAIYLVVPRRLRSDVRDIAKDIRARDMNPPTRIRG